MAALIKLSQHALRDELVRAVDFQDKGLFFEAHFFIIFSVFFSNCFPNLYEQIIKNNNVLKKKWKENFF